MGDRVRLDQLILDRGLAATRGRAQALLLAGRVRVGPGDGARLDRKAGDLVPADTPLQLIESAPFVSRGGKKLARALDSFAVDPAGRVCLDVGASTGGFTDCLLQRGASRVYALDVGRGQLADSLRADPRVVSLERTDARRLLPADARHVGLPERPTLAVVDVAFISLTAVLPAVQAQLAAGGEIVALVKPQFEAPPGETRRGVVRDPEVRRAAVERVADAARRLGLEVLGEMESPLVGPAGNHEWFLHLRGAP
jgi:23S rRNA (cytidine1920-2'-O)/16S rRNA (cytidine1409-2'-O)-methyltransferase